MGRESAEQRAERLQAMRGRLAERFPELTPQFNGASQARSVRSECCGQDVAKDSGNHVQGQHSRRAAAKPKPRREHARARGPQRPTSLPDIHLREHQAKPSDGVGVHEVSSSPSPGGASPEPHIASARVILGQVDAVRAVLEGTVRNGHRASMNNPDRHRRKARETHLNHSETKVRPLAKEMRKQHNHDRDSDGVLQKKKVSGPVPLNNSRSASQSSFQTLETGIFFANVITGMNPERQGYEDRLRNF